MTGSPGRDQPTRGTTQSKSRVSIVSEATSGRLGHPAVPHQRGRDRARARTTSSASRDPVGWLPTRRHQAHRSMHHGQPPAAGSRSRPRRADDDQPRSFVVPVGRRVGRRAGRRLGRRPARCRWLTTADRPAIAVPQTTVSRDVDVAPGRVRVRADLVRLGDQTFGGGAIDVGHADVELDAEAEAAARQRPDADRCRDLGAGCIGLRLPGHQLQAEWKHAE